MNLKRAIGMSVLAYVASLILGIVIAIVLGIDLAETQAIPPSLFYVGMVSAVVFAVLFAYWYFLSPKIEPSIKEGFLFGLIMIATGFILDFVTLLPLFTHENPLEPILTYYLDLLFWITIILILATTTTTGKYLENKRI